VDGAYLNTGYNDWFPVPGQSVDAPKGGHIEVGLRGLYDDTGRLTPGGFNVTLPVYPSTYADRASTQVATFFNDYYNQLHFDPVVLDFGAVSSDSDRIVTVWNAYYRTTVTLEELVYDEAQGIRMEGVTPPVAMPPLGVVSYRVTALGEGPAVISGDIRWVFDAPTVYDLPVAGVRVRLLDLSPAWPPSGQPYRVEYSFSTSVSVSRSGKEQRVANRSVPRKSVSYQTHVTHENFRLFRDSMRYWQHRPWCLPEITRKTASTGVMSVGGNRLRFDELPRWAVPEAQVVLEHDGDYDIKVIEEIDEDENSVTFKSRSSQFWPVGTLVYPGLTGFMRQEISAPRLTNAVATPAIEFDVRPLSEPVEELDEPEVLLDGREVFLRKPNWANRVEGVFTHEAEVLDYGRGPVHRFAPIVFGTETRTATYLSRDYEEAEQIRQLFFRMKGRQGEFYLPTWEYDFRPKMVMQPTVATLRVDGHEFGNIYGDSTVHRALFIQMDDGELLLRKILSIEKISDAFGNDTAITVDGVWGREISEDNVTMMGWLLACRFVSDILTVEWLTNSVANIQLTVMSLEDLPVEQTD